MKNEFSTIEQALEALKSGKMVILVDDEQRENEGDLVLAADFVTPEAINFMAKEARGLICLPMAGELIERLHLPQMAISNRSPYGTAFTISVEAATGVSTGISAQDRAHTVKVAVDPNSRPQDLISPGHMFPLRARDKGVLERPGQTEGSVDLMRILGLTPAAVICEIINDDGTMGRRADLAAFAAKHALPMISIRDLADYRIRHETLLEPLASTRIPVKHLGDFEMTVFANRLDTAEHFILKRPADAGKPPIVRIHSECITGDLLDSCRCDCGAQLQHSLNTISEEGGVLIYLRQEGRGVGLANKLKAYALQEQGLDTVEANIELGLPVDGRDYAVAYQILKYLGIDSLRLLTNNPSKVEALERYGLKVVERLPLMVKPTDENREYLKTKKEKLGHFLPIDWEQA